MRKSGREEQHDHIPAKHGAEVIATGSQHSLVCLQSLRFRPELVQCYVLMCETLARYNAPYTNVSHSNREATRPQRQNANAEVSQGR